MVWLLVAKCAFLEFCVDFDAKPWVGTHTFLVGNQKSTCMRKMRIFDVKFLRAHFTHVSRFYFRAKKSRFFRAKILGLFGASETSNRKGVIFHKNYPLPVGSFWGFLSQNQAKTSLTVWPEVSAHFACAQCATGLWLEVSAPRAFAWGAKWWRGGWFSSSTARPGCGYTFFKEDSRLPWKKRTRSLVELPPVLAYARTGFARPLFGPQSARRGRRARPTAGSGFWLGTLEPQSLSRPELLCGTRHHLAALRVRAPLGRPDPCSARGPGSLVTLRPRKTLGFEGPEPKTGTSRGPAKTYRSLFMGGESTRTSRVDQKFSRGKFLDWFTNADHHECPFIGQKVSTKYSWSDVKLWNWSG